MASTPGRDEDPNSPQALAGAQAYRETLTQVVGFARLQLSLLSFDLDARVYGDEAFVEVVRSFVISHERARLRVLVNDCGRTMRRAHRLVELGRLLSSRIEFRELAEENRGIVEEYLLADERALLHRERRDALDARLQPQAPLAARLKLREFDALWEQSAVAREFSVLGI